MQVSSDDMGDPARRMLHAYTMYTFVRVELLICMYTHKMHVNAGV